MTTYPVDPLTFELTTASIAALYVAAVLLAGIFARALTRADY